MLLNILKRAKFLARQGKDLFATPVFRHFLYQDISDEAFREHPEHLEYFSKLDDTDVMASIKVWADGDDPVLSRLSQSMLNRRLPRVEISLEKPARSGY